MRASKASASLSIGALSAKAAVNLETVRYYERIGLLPSPPRTDGGHRVYSEEHVKGLIFVRRARELGFTLEEVRALLRPADERQSSCAKVRVLAADHLRDVRARIADLKRMERVLSKTVDRCVQGTRPECPLLEILFQVDGMQDTMRADRRNRGESG